MNTTVTQKLSGTSLDISNENKQKLRQILPSVFTETRNEKGEVIESVDFEKLKAELGSFSEYFENHREHYGMDWPGKKEALKLIQTPSAATLKPVRDESVNFDTTENLYIEGDNLEVLKLLQKSYYGKVKMIYIDPPYNTGKEFIYPDNFTESLDTYLEYAGLIDGDGKKFSTNTANEGRFHTKWLNMMYPRLYLARNLLTDDGVIFISIGDDENMNLRRICDEFFGEDNFIDQFIIRSNPRGNQAKKYTASVHEYILIYAKNKKSIGPLGYPIDEEIFNKTDMDGTKYREIGLRKRGAGARREDAQNQYYSIYFYLDKNEISTTKKYGDGFIEIIPKLENGNDGRWRWSKETVENEKDTLIVREVNRNGRKEYDVFEKDFYTEEKITKVKSIFYEKEVNYENGTEELKELFDEVKVFDYPKPTNLIKKCIGLVTKENDIVLDFFAGSATTAHSVLELNKQDSGIRKFVMVQLPEPCSENSEALKAGYKTISDTGKERIRRVIKKMNEEDGNSNKQDRGFKVLKLDRSNFKQWEALEPNTSTERIEEQLELHIDHIKRDATPEDLLYEVLIKAGFKPTEKIESKQMAGKQVFVIADGALLICFEDTVTKELIEEITKVKPMQFICLDSAFGSNDQLKANAVETFRSHNQGKEKEEQIIFKTI